MSKDKLILNNGTSIELEAGQEVQNGAISDLGMVTSTIAEQIGGSV